MKSKFSPFEVLVFAALLTVIAGLGFYDFKTSSISRATDAVVLKEQKDALVYNREILDLAIEFGYDPLIVDTVLRDSATAFRQRACKCPTWRFVKTDKELAYLMLSIIQTESRGNPAAFNPGGPAYGLTQLLLSTAKEHDNTVSGLQLYAIPKNISIAMAHFVDLLEHYNGNYTLAILAWNRGLNGVDRAIAIGNSPESGYARKVFFDAAMRNARGSFVN